MFSRLWDKWNNTGFRMHSSVVLFLFLLFMRHTVFLHVVVNVFWYLSMIGNSSNLWMRCEFLFERFRIVKCRSFTWSNLINKNQQSVKRIGKGDGNTYCAQFFRCSCLPQTNVHFVRPAENVFVIQTPSHTRYALHSFGVINFSWMFLVCLVNSNGLIVTARNEFFARRRVININYSRNVISVNFHRIFQASAVECVQTEIEWELGIW